MGVKTGRPNGRPRKITPHIADLICDLIANGKTISSICKLDGMPHYTTVVDEYIRNTEFADKYARARAAQADYYADEIIDIADETTNDHLYQDTGDGSAKELVNHEAINRSALRVKARQWHAKITAPRKYGDRVMSELDLGDRLEELATMALEVNRVAH